MRKTLFLMFVILSLFLVACSKTEVVKIDEQKTEQPAETAEQPAQEVPTGDVVAVKCTDTDADDIYTSGKVTVTYSDKSKVDYIDECPGGSNIVTEYYCSGNDVKSRNKICNELCVAGICID